MKDSPSTPARRERPSADPGSRPVRIPLPLLGACGCGSGCGCGCQSGGSCQCGGNC